MIARLAQNVLINISFTEIKRAIHIGQIALGTKYGSDHMAHVTHLTSQAVRQNKELAILNVDFKNCFNMLDRKKVLDIVRRKLPRMYPLTGACSTRQQRSSQTVDTRSFK